MTESRASRASRVWASCSAPFIALLSQSWAALTEPLLDVNRPSTCKGCSYQRQLKNGRQWRKFVSTYPSRPASIAAVHESVVGPNRKSHDVGLESEMHTKADVN